MTFLKLSEVLKSSILRSGDPSSLAALRVFKAFQEVFFELYGKKHAKKELARITPKKFSAGVLVIRVPSSVWGQELKLKKEEVLKKLNKNLGGQIVKEIRSRVGTNYSPLRAGR
ncbi:hypothetical protein A2Z23_01320 [Candidatus Curtissbacteria bacterium RBG_16_39_7]|uniref:DUF721 domain-containing protein n=1 Tax=Candidatus Curtissbacteria bacterium RBG_16_39_7 TaxID=1797707 RepID=A0A1F5G2P0_9BACT|nr:MAG: hypothetical protein A2Z23_01320 [Candidatus Curtissbacteria bacterium RBG_16_39_7]